MNIVDAHIHVWSSDFDRYPLAPGFTARRPVAALLYA